MLNPRPLSPAARAAPTAVPATGAMKVIAALLAQRTGQDVMANRVWRIESALQPLLRDRGFADLDALVIALTGDASGRIANAVVDALLNQETSFYRDAGVIELAVEALAARQQAEPARRLRVWSAGCSTGQEPYSLAMLLAERGGEPMPDIVASDVSDHAVARTRAGRYSPFEIQRGLPIRRMLQWFDQDGEEFVAQPALAKLIAPRRHNLVAEPAPYGPFDLILCRNVLLYFPHATRTQVFDRLADALRPGGQLILGAGETTIGQTERFVPSKTYRGAYDLVR